MSDPIILLLSGPNLALLGARQPEIYGSATLEEHVTTARGAAEAGGFGLEHVQSDHEGVLIEAVHGARGRCAAIVINAAAFTHYAWGLHDALASFDGPVVELHLSNPAAREAWRTTSVIAPVATGTISGFGGHGYALAVEAAIPERVVSAVLDYLAPMDVAGRLARLRSVLDADALMVTKLVNLRYLTGFTGSAGLLLVLPDEVVLVTDGRYGQQAAEQLTAAGVDARIEISSSAQREVVAAAVAGAGLAAGTGRLALEADAVTWAQQRTYAESWFPTIELVATVGLVDDLRLVKDGGEVARIAAAASIADEALAHVRPRLLDRPTEQDFGIELDFEIRRLGAWGNSFETIVASGPNGAKPHHRPSARHIVEGDLVVLDFGAVVDGYCSDMTRTVMVGEPSPTQARMLEVVTAAQQAGVEAIADGVAASEIDAACRRVIEDAGWGDAFLHATGHGVGLEIHEAPRVAATADATLVPGVVVTVEPGVYLPTYGGVRVEDTLVVTVDGSRPLTLTPKTTAV